MANQKLDSTPSQSDVGGNLYPIKVWDITTRLFHWILVTLVTVSFVTAKIGASTMLYHEWSGVAILVLVLFRIVWGFVGGRESRFAAFVRGPASVLRYVSTLFQRKPSRHLGHNPLGGWSVLILLISLLIQACTGLFANDDILTEGPLFDLVSKDTSDWLTGIHHLNQTVLLGLICVHVCAILFYLFFKGDNLIYPMFTGIKQWHQDAPFSQSNAWLAAATATLLAFTVYGLIYQIG